MTKALQLVVGIVLLSMLVGLVISRVKNSNSAVLSEQTQAPRILTSTPIPTSSTDQLAISNSKKVSTIKLFFVALNDGGKKGPKIGCGDSSVGVPQSVPQTTKPLTIALQTLLSNKYQYIGKTKLYNALYQSELSVQNILIDNGTATISLSGDFMLSGVCDAPRVQAQLEQTALQFGTIKKVLIFVNGKPLADVLSQK